MDKAFLIKFTLYTSIEGEHDYEEKTLLVYAETYEKAVDKIKEKFEKENCYVQDEVNLTIL